MTRSIEPASRIIAPGFLNFVAWSAGLKVSRAMRLHIAVEIRMVRRQKETRSAFDQHAEGASEKCKEGEKREIL
jgi:hypothetical protein